MIDDGAPQISAAEYEFEELARVWQQQAAKAAANAAHYTALASAMRKIYDLTIARVTAHYDSEK